ncbi:hypothetical protein AURDEDRAFT_165904 [Auricularia subglabra TFB-10046 SS5]|nr:hypothetical protein AURDEDRAFT_165904 [Auricularia subglabra TFB-10046 SS5]
MPWLALHALRIFPSSLPLQTSPEPYSSFIANTGGSGFVPYAADVAQDATQGNKTREKVLVLDVPASLGEFWSIHRHHFMV